MVRYGVAVGEILHGLSLLEKCTSTPRMHSDQAWTRGKKTMYIANYVRVSFVMTHVRKGCHLQGIRPRVCHCFTKRYVLAGTIAF